MCCIRVEKRPKARGIPANHRRQDRRRYRSSSRPFAGPAWRVGDLFGVGRRENLPRLGTSATGPTASAVCQVDTRVNYLPMCGGVSIMARSRQITTKIPSPAATIIVFHLSLRIG